MIVTCVDFVSAALTKYLRQRVLKQNGDGHHVYRGHKSTNIGVYSLYNPHPVLNDILDTIVFSLHPPITYHPCRYPLPVSLRKLVQYLTPRCESDTSSAQIITDGENTKV